MKEFNQKWSNFQGGEILLLSTSSVYYSQGEMLHLGEWIMFRITFRMLLQDETPTWDFPAALSIPVSSVDGKRDLERWRRVRVCLTLPGDIFINTEVHPSSHWRFWSLVLELWKSSPHNAVPSWSLTYSHRRVVFCHCIHTIQGGKVPRTSHRGVARLSPASGSTAICPTEGRI